MTDWVATDTCTLKVHLVTGQKEIMGWGFGDIDCRIREWLGLEGAPSDHLVQTPAKASSPRG